MRLRLTLAAMALLLALSAAGGPPPPAGADSSPTPAAYAYLPLVLLDPTPAPTATPSPTPTRTPAAACGGDEEITFVPDPGATGAVVEVSVTSAQASANVAMQVLYGGAKQPVNWQGVVDGGKGYIWTWTFTPYQPGWYDASFYVNDTAFCAGRSVQVQGAAAATPTPTPTPTDCGPVPADWDGRLSFLNICLHRASGSPRWSVVEGVFQDWNEGSQGHAIYVDVLDQYGNRLDVNEGTVVGTLSWPGGSVPLQWGAKPPNEYPMNYPMDGYTLGAYSVWLTFDSLPSDVLTGMGMVGTDEEGNLLPVPGPVHVNYLFIFRKTW